MCEYPEFHKVVEVFSENHNNGIYSHISGESYPDCLVKEFVSMSKVALGLMCPRWLSLLRNDLSHPYLFYALAGLR